VLLAVLSVYLWAGAVRLARPISDFYMADGRVPVLPNAMAIAAPVIAILALPALAGAMRPGWSGGLVLLLSAAAGLVIAGFLLAPNLRAFGGYTLSDFLAERFGGSWIRPLSALAVIGCSLPVLAAVLLGLGVLIAEIFPISVSAGIAAGALLVVLCSVIGGLRSASKTQAVQYAVLLGVSLAVLAMLFWRLRVAAFGYDFGGVDLVVWRLELLAFAGGDPLNALALVVCLVAGIASMPAILMRSFAASTVTQARNSFLFALPLIALVGLAAPAYVLLFEPVSSANAVLHTLLAIGGIAALLAAGSGFLLAAANAFSHDIFFKTWHPTAPTQRRLLIARSTIALASGLAAFAAFTWPIETVTSAEGCFSLAASAFLPALLLGVWWKRATGEGALAGMLVGLAVCLYYLLAPRYLPFAFYETSSFLSNASPEQAATYGALRESYYLADPAAKEAVLAAWQEAAREAANWWGVNPLFAAVFAVPLGFLATVAVSLFTPAPHADAQRFATQLDQPVMAS
jgi:cation/acetate symporter